MGCGCSGYRVTRFGRGGFQFGFRVSSYGKCGLQVALGMRRVSGFGSTYMYNPRCALFI